MEKYSSYRVFDVVHTTNTHWSSIFFNIFAVDAAESALESSLCSWCARPPSNNGNSVDFAMCLLRSFGTVLALSKPSLYEKNRFLFLFDRQLNQEMNVYLRFLVYIEVSL